MFFTAQLFRVALSGALVLHVHTGVAQKPVADDRLDHQVQIERMKNAGELFYRDALQHFDQHLARHPEDVQVHVERCAFIGSAMYDEYEEVNPNQAAHDSCLIALAEAFPDHPQVILYRADQVWGDEKIELLVKAVQQFEWAGETQWNDDQKASAYRQLAHAHYYDDQFEAALEYIEQAAALNPEDRASLLRANILVNNAQREEAREALYLPSGEEADAWQLQQRANLLVELEDHEHALVLYERVQELDSAALDHNALAKIMEGMGEYDRARYHFVQDTIGQWQAMQAAFNLFEHDLRHQSPDTGLASYAAFRDHGFDQDPFGLYRFKLFLRAPLLSWQARDLLGPLLLLIVIGVLFLLPYLWVLPIHFIGHRWPHLKRQVIGLMDWNLKHLWWVSAGFLIASLVAVLDCPECISSYFTDSWATGEEDTELEGRIIMIFILFLGAWSLPLLFRTGLDVFRSPTWTVGRTIGQAVGFFLVFRFVGTAYIKLASTLFDIDHETLVGLTSPLAIAQPEVLAFLKSYGGGLGLLLLALFVPLYEEVIFRGVMLNSSMRYLGFPLANTFQAGLFAVVHGSLFLAPFFFAFGLATGVLTRRSESLLAGVIFHAVNNFLAVWVIMRTLNG